MTGEEAKLPRGLRLRHRRAARPAADYRGAPERAELHIERRFFHAGHVVGVVCVAVSAAILARFWWERVQIAQDFYYGTPATFYFAALALVAFSLFLALRFTRKQTIRITQNALVVRGGRRDRTIAASEVVQLFVRHLEDPPFGYQVMATLEGDETMVLVGNLDRSDQARYVERQIEETLGLADEPVDAELPRDAPAEQLLDRSRIPATLASVGVVVATVTLVVSSRGCVQPVGVLPVSIGGGETSLEVDLDRARSLRVLADVTVSGAYVSRTTSKQRSSEDLPNTLRVEIVVDHPEARQTVVCDPLDVFFRSSSHSGSTWSFDGTIRDCRLEVPAGPATLRARLAGDAGPDFELRELVLLPAR